MTEGLTELGVRVLDAIASLEADGVQSTGATIKTRLDHQTERLNNLDEIIRELHDLVKYGLLDSSKSIQPDPLPEPMVYKLTTAGRSATQVAVVA